uniref:RING finger protein 17 n=1 Tax=Dendroctonus ponderosae TaxID=77166 RepID=A0AAR5PJI1_DENPD
MFQRGRVRVPKTPNASNAFNSGQYYANPRDFGRDSTPHSSSANWSEARSYDPYSIYQDGRILNPQNDFSLGLGRGGGLINAQPAPLNVFESSRKPKTRRSNQGNSSNHSIDSISNSTRKSKTPVQSREETGTSMYSCPKCKTHYTSQNHRQASRSVPLILHCGHTMCRDCIYQGLKNNKITCFSCSSDSTFTGKQSSSGQYDLQNVFPPNYYILGVLTHRHVAGDCTKNLENLSLVDTEISKARSAEASKPTADICCFDACRKQATMFCSSCDGFYCLDCCTVVHKSIKRLMSHTPKPIRRKEFSFVLESCMEHPKMQFEFFCKTCDLNACCYCVLDKHTDHERVALYSLSAEEMEEFKKQKRMAGNILRDVLVAQKKVSKLANFDTGDIKKDVLHYFSDYHSRLQCLENKILNELDKYKFDSSGLNEVQSSLQKHADELEQLVCFDEDAIRDQKMNLRGAFNKLLKIEDIPRFFLSKSDKVTPISFVANYSDLGKEIFIKQCEDFEYQLVGKNNLPEDYVVESEPDVEIKAKLNGFTSNIDSVTRRSEGSPARTENKAKKPAVAKKQSGFEKVEVQHINSLESFFVHYKRDQSKLNQLNKDIESYVKMGGAETVANPQLDTLYLVLYIIESLDLKEQKWCRARLTDIKSDNNDTLYEMSLIDYGKVQCVGINRIRDIPTNIAQKKPFAIECMLYNPMDFTWRKDAHYSLAKLLIEKDVIMMEKGYSNGICQVELMIASTDGGATSVIDVLIYAQHSVASSNDDSVSADESQSSSKKEVCYPALKVFSNSTTFTKNEMQKVVIVNVVDPYNIFVHLVKNQEAMKSMNHEIKKAFKSHSSKGCMPIEGTYALVEHRSFMSAYWHRALIKRVDINLDTVHVLLVDWGINVIVSTNKIKPLQKHLTKVESQAVLVKLAHIAPSNNQSVWPAKAANFLHTYQRSQEVLKMIVQDVKPDIEVALFSMNTNADICLNAAMVEHNLANSTGQISTQRVWQRLAEAEDSDICTNDGLVSSLLKKVDEEAKFEDGSDEEDLSGIAKKRVDIVKVESPELIWLKFVHFKDREREMFKNLQVHYSQDHQTQPKWEVGELCVTESDNQYARGKITKAVGNDYSVYLVDQIKHITVSVDKIYKYNQYFARYQQAVFKCHLANIRPAGDTGQWSISSIEALQEIFRKHHRIYAAIVNNEESDLSTASLAIDMWYGLIIRGGALEPDKIKYVSIANSLIKFGFAFRLSRTKPTTYTAEAAFLKDIPNIQSEVIEEKCSITPCEPQKKTWYEEILESAEAGESNSSTGLSKSDSIEPENPADPTQPCGTDDEHSCEDDAESICNKNEVEITDWLPPFKIVDRYFRARVTCVETGGHLFVHTAPLHEAYLKMEANIKAFFDRHPPSVSDQAWQAGELCTIKFNDGNWYRGKVLSTDDSNMVYVYMIDFGSDHKISRDELFREVLYTEIRAFATKIKLNRVFDKSGSWLTSDYDHFRDLVTDWCRIVIEGSLDVELPLADVYNNEQIFINQRLVELCPNLSRSSVEPGEIIEDDNTVIENIEIEEVISNHGETDDPIDSNSELAESDQTSYLESKFEDTTLKYKVQELPIELLRGEKMEMFMGGIKDYNKICIRLIDASTSEDMYDLASTIQDEVPRLPPMKDFAIGKPCLGQFSEDKEWYRAKIVDFKSEDPDVAELLFVDYGNYETASKERIKCIRAKDMELHQLCWEVNLNIVSIKDTDVTNITKLLRTFDRKYVHVKLVSRNPLTVDLYERIGTLLYDKFIRNGVVKPLFA